ncbi:MAG TPA: hypothetical protein PK280_09375 [Planctomycetota bacterium]|nr:hypothetical protein [Planctomycetota bacterium]
MNVPGTIPILWRCCAAALFLAASAAYGLAGEGAAPPKAEESKSQAVFVLADGSRVVGESGIKEVAIKTAYGEVTVPAAEVIRIRVARSSDKAAREKVAALIKQLGAPNFDDREKAFDELCKLGPVAVGQLQESLKHPDAEVRNRVEKILAEVERGGEEEAESEEAPLGGDEDELVTKRFTIRGVIKVERFELRTRYGSLAIPREDVVSATLARAEAMSRTVKVTGQHTMGGMVGTGLRVKAGDRVAIRASGSITFRNWGETCGPDGNQERFGTVGAANLPGMALVGRVGSGGKPFLIGGSKSFSAEGEGELFLGIAFEGRGAGQSTGEYKTSVTVTPRSAK